MNNYKHTIMNRIARLFALMGVLLMALSFYSCGKDTPTPPSPPAPPEKPIRFSQEQVELTLEKNSTTVTLENFTGTLTQEGQVTGLKVTISGSVIKITAEQYLPGDYTLVFKGEGKTYSLKVRLQKMPQMKSVGVFTSTGEPLLQSRFTSLKFAQGRVSRFVVAANQDRPRRSMSWSLISRSQARRYPSPSRLMASRRWLMEHAISPIESSVVSRAPSSLRLMLPSSISMPSRAMVEGFIS